ncbi:MAG TPA: alanine/ornithine racemase family PLP-dependent enzyme [Acholeplasmataceae bacterium]|nr:alanine/ornithine racemase family PLP-dependent enzyme [Acholeplasmataceae bacterium]HRX45396.1 alanine/ornithine racemase family PLP-dependent enzyme [Acholeplasmataceae bacterium]
MFPKMTINVNYYKDNLRYMMNLLKRQHIKLVPVSKVFRAEQPLIDVINQMDIEVIADSRISNLKQMVTQKKKMLLRIPMLSEVPDVIEHADISLNSELEVIEALNEEARRQKKIHSVILMYDLGDLREGIFYHFDDIRWIEKIKRMKHIHFMGIGTNLTCFGGVIPTKKTYTKLHEIKQRVEQIMGHPCEIISGGNSSSLPLVMDEKLPKFINQLRVGEALVCGRETAYGNDIIGMHQDVFTLDAEIIELKIKPSKPEGKIGVDAFGHRVRFSDRGMIKRAILALGKQDIALDQLKPPAGVTVLGSSSDHLIVELDDDNYKVGDVIHFGLSYGGILSLMTSSYVEKNYVI